MKLHFDWFRIVVGSAVIIGGTLAPACGRGHDRRTPVVEAVEKVGPATVSITSEKNLVSHSRWPFDADENPRHVSGMGTGVIIDPRGYIVTNHHVVDKVTALQVHLVDGPVLAASVVASDPERDLAVLKVDGPQPLPYLRLGNSDDLMVGETVIAIGNAYGYEHTVSMGIVSALKRTVKLTDAITYADLIQTDASINPGNSGGPLVNINGELIGINVAVRAGAQGIGFAIPARDVEDVVVRLLSIRRLKQTWHGMVCRAADTADDPRVIVQSVAVGSPAAASGVRPGDQVLRINGEPIENRLDIERALLGKSAGQKSKLVIRRGSGRRSLTLAVARVPGLVSSPEQVAWQRLGLRLRPVPADQVEVAGVEPPPHGGLLVAEVAQGSPAAGKIQTGDILIGLNRWETLSLENVTVILTKVGTNPYHPLHYFVVRADGLHEGQIALPGFVSTRQVADH